jgi:hypothetical protein
MTALTTVVYLFLKTMTVSAGDDAMPPKLKAHVVVRVENDDYALLYDSNTGACSVLDPVGVFICNKLNGNLSIGEIVQESRAAFSAIPDDAAEQVSVFVETLIAKQLAEA